jgi:acetyl esterase/lipase
MTRISESWLGLGALLALGTLCGCRGAKPAPVQPAAQFTRESVLERLRASYPFTRLPPDDLPAGVRAQEDLVYARVPAETGASDPTTDLALDLYLPAGAGPHPAVIVVHGGGWERGDRRAERPFAKRLAGLGYVAAPVSYRLGPAGRFPNALFDLEGAVRWLRANAARYDIDPSHIGAVGGSAGGHLVALLGATAGVAALRPGGSREVDGAVDVQAVVDIDGLADFTGPSLVAKEDRTPGAPTRFLGGSFAHQAATWRLASPLTHVSARSAPTLFINSSATSGAPRADAPILPGRLEMRNRLRSVGVDAEIVIFPDTPHPFWLVNPWFEGVLSQTDIFLRRHLRGIK